MEIIFQMVCNFNHFMPNFFRFLSSPNISLYANINNTAVKIWLSVWSALLVTPGDIFHVSWCILVKVILLVSEKCLKLKHHKWGNLEWQLGGQKDPCGYQRGSFWLEKTNRWVLQHRSLWLLNVKTASFVLLFYSLTWYEHDCEWL